MEFQKNETVSVRIEDIGTEGEGIGKVEGFTLFVKDAVPGDTVLAKILKCKKNYAYARLEKVETPSPFRVEPECRYYRQCGGCQLQSLSYEKQLQFKQNKIRNNLIRIGGFDAEYVDQRMEPIVGMDEPWHYRNKAQYPVGTDKDGNPITGFYAGRTHSIIANTDCALGVPENKEILERVLEYMKENRVSAYNELTGQGLIRHVLIRKGFTSGEIMVCLVVNSDKKTLPNQEKLLSRLTDIPNMTSVSISINRERTNVIMGKEIHTLWGKDTISDTIHVRDMQKTGYPFTGHELTFAISPLSFYQVNPLQTRRLYETALEFAKLQGNETVWDLYCGIGTISLFLAQKAAQVYGVEIVPQAIEDARKNARLNGITNAEFFVGAAEQVVPEKYAQSGGTMRADVVSLDPPRKGCDEKLLQTVVAMAPEKIVYVSCDPATLARDLKYLCAEGYEVRRVRACDMFPHTSHVETVCLLSKLHEAKHHVNVKLDMDEMDLTSAESKATYEEIKAYVAEHNDGMQVSNLYIAQVKAKYGIKERANYNLPKLEDVKQPHCPKEKEDAIVEALRFFHMI